ncbi:MAG TPA: AAA family ATPase, partial [Pirellulales bacterium]|nr:AAA family ATPase [Pirellulales bacterium]
MEPIIKTLTLRRFRSFSDAEVQFDNPTFLIGPNGSGKSNLVDSLSFLQEAMDTQVGPALMRRGGFETVKHRAGGTIAFDQMGFGVALGKPHDEATAGRYAFVLRGSARGFVVDREQCVVDRQDGDRDWFEHSEDRFQSNVAGISPAVQSAALTLPVIGGDRRFEPVLRALSGIRKCAIEPSRLREWQGANGAGLRADGANAAAMLHTI